MTPTPTPIPGCPVCDGTGRDEVFDSPCNCLAHVGRTSLARQLAGDVHVHTTPNPHPHGLSRGRGHGHARSTDVTNNYDGACVVCGVRVEAGAGVRVREGQGWATKHPVGTCSALHQSPVRPSTAGATPQAPAVRANRYAGRCVRCNVEVPAEAGTITKVDGRWLVAHVECPAVPAPSSTGLDLRSIPAARYAVPGGSTRLKVRIDHEDKGQWAGWTFVRDAAEYGTNRLYGKQAPGGTYRGDIVAELTAIVADSRAAAVEYTRLVGRCSCCHRKLEAGESVERGMGPVCYGRFG